MAKLLDILKLLGVAILLIGSIVAFKMWNPFSHDNKIVTLAGALAVELCECTGPSCAERVMAEAEAALVGQRVSRNPETGGDAHSKAHLQVMHMQRCFALLQDGKEFSVSVDDGMVTHISEPMFNDFTIDIPTLVE